VFSLVPFVFVIERYKKKLNAHAQRRRRRRRRRIMTTLAESFLADLDDLSDDDDDDGEEEEEVKEEKEEFAKAGVVAVEHGGGGVKEEVKEEEAKEQNGSNNNNNNNDNKSNNNFSNALEKCTKLLSADRYARTVGAVEREIAKIKKEEKETTTRGEEDEDEEEKNKDLYKLILDCNALTVDIDDTIVFIHNYIKDKYKKKFPELESLVPHPIDYARVVQKIANEMDIMRVDLESVLPSATIMVVTVTGSTTDGKELSDADLELTLEACDRLLKLDNDKTKLFKFVEKNMEKTAPNLSQVLGTDVAARIMGLAGGLELLSKMPSNVVQNIGNGRKKNIAGSSLQVLQKSGDVNVGFIFQCDLIQKKTPPPLRVKAVRLIAGKCTLMARVDAFGQDPTGETGKKMYADIEQKIEKWQEPPPARTEKPLPAPGMIQKKRRGGKRMRAIKERYGMSDMRKQANRVGFNVAEDEIGYEGEGLGLLGKSAGAAAANGKLRFQEKKAKIGKYAQKGYKGGMGSGLATSDAGLSGMSSSLAFTPIQGIELVNPNAEKESRDSQSGTDSVFNDRRGFFSTKK
jgi:U4/U6 small nuclear ribonucleoprotein PRP31